MLHPRAIYPEMTQLSAIAANHPPQRQPCLAQSPLCPTCMRLPCQTGARGQWVQEHGLGLGLRSSRSRSSRLVPHTRRLRQRQLRLRQGRPRLCRAVRRGPAATVRMQQWYPLMALQLPTVCRSRLSQARTAGLQVTAGMREEALLHHRVTRMRVRCHPPHPPPLLWAPRLQGVGAGGQCSRSQQGVGLCLAGRSSNSSSSKYDTAGMWVRATARPPRALQTRK